MRRFLRQILTIVALGSVAFGCSLRSMSKKSVAPDFTIVVSHLEKPLIGARVNVFVKDGSEEPIFTELTDKHGKVQLHLSPGEYFVSSTFAGITTQTEWIEISPTDPKALRTVEFGWAEWSIETKALAGRLTGLIPGSTGNRIMDIVHAKEVSYSGVALKARNVVTNDEFQAVSDADGGFNISGLPEGIYFLEIGARLTSIDGTSEVENVVVDLKHSAKRRFLPLRLQQTGCGGVAFSLREEPSS